MTKLSRTLQLDGEWEVGLTEIDYPHTWYNIREGKNSAEICVPDKWAQEISVQPGYYEKVIDVIDTLRKADVVVTYHDTSKRVTVMFAKGAILKLRGDMARMFCFLNNTMIRAFDKKGYLKLEINIFMFMQISWWCCCSCSSYCYSIGKTWMLC